MISYHKQLHRHAPEEGLVGDCWRTCIACILGLRPTEVPHFVEAAFHDQNDGHITAANAWLAKRNLTLLQLCLRADDTITANRFALNAPYILSGRGDAGIDHCVVAHGPFLQLHDPSPWATAPLQPLQQPDGPDYWWLDFLVPINLAAQNAQEVACLAVPAL